MITILIIVVTVAASFYAWQKQEIYRKWVMNPYLVKKNNEYFRFLTSGFLHADHIHLFINMFVLYSFGRALENFFFIPLYGQIGALIFLLFYLAAIAISEIPTFLKHQNDSWYNSLGASGAVSAIVFAMIILNPMGKISLFFLIDLPSVVFGILFLAYSYFSSKKQSDNINHDAHFYGAVFGILFIIIAEPSTLPAFIEQIGTQLF